MQVSRDPFAREEVHRELAVAKDGGCDWCGNHRINTRTGRRMALFHYYIESDSGRRSDIPGDFCSISCMKALNT